MRYICALTIAGSDSCGGAGVQADIKTMSALGVYAASAITSVTVQNTLGVQAIQAIQPEIVAGQIRAVMDDIKPTAIKVGMVNDQATILTIADTLQQYSPQKLIVDPVMVSTSGSCMRTLWARSAVACSLWLPCSHRTFPKRKCSPTALSALLMTWMLQDAAFWHWAARLCLSRADILYPPPQTFFTKTERLHGSHRKG